MGGRERTCCFTGHRPEKLPWGWDEEDPRCRRLKEKLRDAVETAYEEGMRHFICGMARGCDFYFAEAVLDLRRRRPGVTLEAAIPCAGQSRRWSPAQRRRWRNLVSACGLETLGEREVLPVDCRGPEAQPGTGRECALWFDPDTHALLRGELSQDGYTVIQCTFSDFQVTPGAEG